MNIIVFFRRKKTIIFWKIKKTITLLQHAIKKKVCCVSLIRLLCLLVFCVIITSASVAPFSVGYSKTYIGLEAQFGFTHFNLCINLILKSSKTKYREKKLCEGTSSVLSRKVPHYALDIKHCRMRIWRFGVRWLFSIQNESIWSSGLHTCNIFAQNIHIQDPHAPIC